MSSLQIVVAPDSFKGTMSSVLVCDKIAEGLNKAWPDVKVVTIPIADGGEGTVDAFMRLSKGVTITNIPASDPLGREMTASYGLIENGKTAVIEMATATGLPLLNPSERNPMLASSYGTGSLIRHAIENGAKKIILGVGGTATVDGGMGIATALGAVFLDQYDNPLPGRGGNLGLVEKVDCTNLISLNNISFTLAVDVLSPLLGPNGTALFSKQKGATQEMSQALEKGLEHYVNKLEQHVAKNLKDTPGTGAGGGAALPLLAFSKAEIQSGFEIIAQLSSLEEKIKASCLVLTGEGRLDRQTRLGKAPIGVAHLAKKHNIPVIAVCGRSEPSANVLNQEGITAFFALGTNSVAEWELVEKSPAMLASLSQQIGYLAKRLILS